MSKIYVIADTHFGHRKVTEFRPWKTVEQHDYELVQRWNATVREKDTVWHLGDVYFGGAEAHSILGQLAGNKKLVMGNHDGYPSELYLRYFSRVFGAAEVDGCLLTHIPCNPNQLERYKKNIHGHMHAGKIDDPRYVCVSAEQTGYAPILLKPLVG